MSDHDRPHEPRLEPGGRYAKYALGVLLLVYVFNFIDRQILSILAEEIKADLGISDADMGFLYGTAFAVFYAVFGIPLARLADTWVRKSLISIGLAFWSLMTALSGTARNFATLAAYRIGVGVGEASATPAAFSMLSDYFPPSRRATVLGLYSSGVYIGQGIGMFLGGLIVDGWTTMFPDAQAAPLSLKGWQVAFMVVGLPGIVMALVVWRLHEPKRGASENMVAEPHEAPFREFFRALAAVVPPFTVFYLLAKGGARAVVLNLMVALVTGALAYGLNLLTGTPNQWIALALGVYAAASWVQGLKFSDRATFGMMFGCRTLLLISVGFPCIGFVTYGLSFWSAPFILRVHDVGLTEAGTVLGVAAAVGGWLGITVGGIIADRLKARTPNGRLYVGIAAPVLTAPFAVWFVLTSHVWIAYACGFFFSVFSSMWIGSGASTVNDLVMPRMRALASACYLMMMTFIGLALGPYVIGQISDVYMGQGLTDGEALRRGMLWGSAMLGVSLIFLLGALRYLRHDESERLVRAKMLGEAIG